MERRVVETLYPKCNINKTSNSLWRWIVDKLWPKRDVDTKPEHYDSESFLFPWHMMKSMDNDLYVLTRSFETLWIMDLASGVIKYVVKGFPKILKVCGQMILESSLLKQMPLHCLQQQVGTNCSLEGIPYAGLMSSVVTFQDHVIICDTGRIDIQLTVDIPEDAVLVEPLKEGSIWRQARGAATEVSEEEVEATSLEKVGVAQQWYNELDELASLTPKLKLRTDEEGNTSDGKVQDEKICIKSAINTSPGTCQVIINAAIYLKMKPASIEDSKEKYTSSIVHHLNCKSGWSRRDQCLKHLLASNMDIGDLVFIRPLNVKLLFDCLNHPKAKNSKDISLTNSSIEVNVTLN